MFMTHKQITQCKLYILCNYIVLYLLRLVGVVQDSIARLSTGVDSKGETFLLSEFGTQVGSQTIANKTKQGIGRSIVVGQAEVRSTRNHFNNEKSAKR